jgi:hypothetical protein
VIAKWDGRSVLSLRKLLMGSAGSRRGARPNGILAVAGISEAIRPVFFQTDLDDFLYATHGGTLFLISFQGRSYALTCEIARNIAPIFKGQQRTDFVTKDETSRRRVSRPSVTPPQLRIYARYQWHT